MELNTIAHMDIFDLCDCLEDDSIDMILADLPYGITACSWDTIIPLEPMWEQFKRIIKPRGAIVLTASGKFKYQLVMSNMDMFKYEWVWAKSKTTMFIHAKNRPLSGHENVLVFSDGVINHKELTEKRMQYFPIMTAGKPYTRKDVSKQRNGVVGVRPSHIKLIGKTRGNDCRYPNTILEFANGNNFSTHVSQKPVALFEYLIRTYTQPGETVFDPVVGSGTTAIAARNTGRNFICGDSSEKYVKVARERLALPYTLPMFDEQPKQEASAMQFNMFEFDGT